MSSIIDDNDTNRHHFGGSGEMTSSKKECTSCEQNNNVDNITEGINSVVLDDVSKCANCGKEGNSSDMNTCNKCKGVKYCNAACKKKHRSKHKKACERRVAELYEEELFKEVEPEECPICLLPLPIGSNTLKIQTCCGKLICSGCTYEMKMSEGKDLCAFCRTPPPSSNKDCIQRVKKLMDKGIGDGFYQLAWYYSEGSKGVPQDYRKANELFLKAGELGCAVAYHNLGVLYRDGRGVEVDEKKTKYYYELAAIGGDIHSRHNLGCIEYNAGNYDRAIKHFIISARAGSERSLENVKVGFMRGIVTKDEFASTLRAHQLRKDEMKNDARDKAAAIDMMGQWI